MIVSFDLHVLSIPPAFVLSQDQTLNKSLYFSLSAFISVSWITQVYTPSRWCFIECISLFLFCRNPEGFQGYLQVLWYYSLFYDRAFSLESFSIISSFLVIVKLFFEILLSSFQCFSCVSVASARDNFISIRSFNHSVNAFLKIFHLFSNVIFIHH